MEQATAEAGKLGKIKTFVHDYIKKEQLSPGDKLPAVRTLAKHTDSSILTVHRAISSMVGEGFLSTRRGAGIFVSDKRPVASKRIAVIFPFDHASGNSYLSEMFHSISNASVSDDFHTIGIQEKTANLSHLLKNRFGGVIAYCNHTQLAEIESVLTRSNLPVVCINDAPQTATFSRVGTNNFSVGKLAASHFLERGHRNCIILPYSTSGSTCEDRITGFRLQAGESATCTVFMEKAETDDYIPAAAEHIKKHPELTAAFAINDTIALRLIQRLGKLGIRVPEDISIIGCDNRDFCEHLDPALTSVAQPTEKIGHAAISMIREMILSRDHNKLTQVFFDPELIVRDSVIDIH